MLNESTMNGGFVPSHRFRPLAIMAVIVALAAVLILAVMVPGDSESLLAQNSPDCPVTDLGALGAEDGLQANGRWTTDGCDSRFRINSNAHNYRFEISEPGRIRINLTSADADSYLYLMAEDGSRITDNDDGGAALDARIERTLEPGIYLVEATTVGGRSRGAANFTISVSYVEGCEITDLGALLLGVDLTASGVWTIDTCGSRIAEAHPAYSYSFALPEAGTVRIDLVSEDGDPVLSLASAAGNVIGANDDGGGHRNSRIEQYMQAGVYLIEATTYWVRDIQPRSAEFDLTIHLVDEEEKQGNFLIKIEAAQAPDKVVAGEPFTVDYRVGNLGGGDLAEVGGNAWVYVVGPRVFERTGEIAASEDRWQAGVSYHSGEEAASAVSASIDELAPLEAAFRSPGASWIFVAVVVHDENDDQVGWHGIWHDLMVLSGYTFDPVQTRVARSVYEVSAEADEEGLVTNAVASVSNPDADVDPDIQAKAIYAAGVRTQLLEGLFDRPALSDLTVGFARQMLTLENPSSSTLLDVFTSRYTSDIAATGLNEGLASAEADLRATLEDRLLDAADTASAHYSSIAASWTAHQVWAGTGRALSFTEALNIQSQLAYAERIASPTIAAGEIVQAARAAELGWEDPEVQAMVDDFASQASCRSAETSLRTGLEAAGIEDVDALMDIDAEMREALPFFGLANDSVLCALEDLDSDNSRFLGNLSIVGNEAIQEIFTPDTPEPQVVLSPHKLRIIAMLGDDGRIELGVEVSGGDQVLPDLRHLHADSPVGVWLISSDVEVDGGAIGKIRARRLDDGRVELGFLSADGETVTPNIRFLASDISAGVWLRSSEIEVQQVGQLE